MIELNFLKIIFPILIIVSLFNKSCISDTPSIKTYSLKEKHGLFYEYNDAGILTYQYLIHPNRKKFHTIKYNNKGKVIESKGVYFYNFVEFLDKKSTTDSVYFEFEFFFINPYDSSYASITIASANEKEKKFELVKESKIDTINNEIEVGFLRKELPKKFEICIWYIGVDKDSNHSFIGNEHCGGIIELTSSKENFLTIIDPNPR